MANPYQAPIVEHETPAAPTSGRVQARASLRLSLLFLLIAGLYNYAAFDARYIGFSGLPGDLQWLFRITNLLGICVLSVVLWFATLPLLEWLARQLRLIAAPRSSAQLWLQALYVSLRPAATLAAAGAILWALWVFGIYFVNANFLLISYAVGIPAHLLAAGIYVPLAYRWYLLWRSAGHETT